VDQQAIDRFWSKVAKAGAGDCWPWSASTVRGGYGKFSIESRYVQAHRLSWVLAHGQISGALLVLHRCDNPPCVNPSHLFLGTHLDNVIDMYAKGRQPNRARTSCLRGHELTNDNTYHFASGKRACRRCVLARPRRHG